jgi:dienelactone hydrolase
MKAYWLGSWGYVALAVDSPSPRAISSACRGGSLGQAFDAYAALRYLTTLEDVDPARIAVLGQSMGGGSALYALDHDLGAQYFTERFRAAILYYPGCGIPGANLTAPTLILIGDKDDWTPADRCRDMVVRARSDGAPITLHVYPGVHHAFDLAQLRPGIRNALGHWLEYDEAAAQDAEQKTHLSCAASGPGSLGLAGGKVRHRRQCRVYTQPRRSPTAIANGRKGARHKVAALQPAARGQEARGR